MSQLTLKLTHRLLILIGAPVIRLLGFSLRLKRINSRYTDELQAQNKPYILCAWHGRLFLPVFYHRNKGIVAMVSRHADGEVIARIVHKLGYGTVRGSSGRGGREAFLQLLSHLKKGGSAAMIADGPLGPPFQLKIGTVMLAREAGCPLIPITFAARPHWRLKSWDRHVLPKFFAQCVLCYGEPILVPAQATSEELEAWRLKIETAMNDLVRSAEERLAELADRKTAEDPS